MPLNQSGGGPAPADAYEVYSALYQAPMQEPLAFAEDSVTDIPQVNGNCLRAGDAAGARDGHCLRQQPISRAIAGNKNSPSPRATACYRTAISTRR